LLPLGAGVQAGAQPLPPAFGGCTGRWAAGGAFADGAPVFLRCEIHTLRVQGLSMAAIARRLGLDHKTVRRYLRADRVEQLVAGGVRVSKLDPFKPYLHQRLTAGVRGATALYAELAEQGYTGSYQTVERYLQPVRRSDSATVAQVLRNRPPPVRQVTAWITGLPGHLDTADQACMTAIRGRCPEIDAATRHVAAFARMIKDLSGDEEKLTALTAAVDHDLPALRSFTKGLRRTSRPSAPG